MDNMLKEKLRQVLTEEQLEKVSGGDLFDDYLDQQDEEQKLAMVRSVYQAFGLETALAVAAAYGWSALETKQKLGIVD